MICVTLPDVVLLQTLDEEGVVLLEAVQLRPHDHLPHHPGLQPASHRAILNLYQVLLSTALRKMVNRIGALGRKV